MADRFVLVWAAPNEQGLQEAYGSLIEIGISHALEKPILFAYHSGVDLRPFWFAVEASTAVVWASNPDQAFELVRRCEAVRMVAG